MTSTRSSHPIPPGAAVSADEVRRIGIAWLALIAALFPVAAVIMVPRPVPKVPTATITRDGDALVLTCIPDGPSVRPHRRTPSPPTPPIGSATRSDAPAPGSMLAGCVTINQ